MKTSTILIIVGAAVVGFAVYWFVIRKKPAVGGLPGSTYSPGAVTPMATVQRGPGAAIGVGLPASAPIATPGGSSVRGTINQGIALAATAGCAAAAGAYTGGAALPLCGAAGPLAIGISNAAVSGAKAVGGLVSKICIPIPFVHKC